MAIFNFRRCIFQGPPFWGPPVVRLSRGVWQGKFQGPNVQALMESAGDVLVEVIVVEDGTSPAIPRPDFTGALVQECQLI